VCTFRATLVSTLMLYAAIAIAAELPQIPNLMQPSEHVLIGGQPDEAALRQAADAGIQAVVNLRGEGEQVDFDESALVSELGMEYYWLPIAAPADLAPENVQAFDRILDAVGDRPVLMHCSSGNRVGALFALHAGMYQGMEVEAAIERGRAHGLSGLENTVRTLLEGAAAE
jgi:uncharacterized protein (TIGR01244 family)